MLIYITLPITERIKQKVQLIIAILSMYNAEELPLAASYLPSGYSDFRNGGATFS
jgi:hypothetical protein